MSDIETAMVELIGTAVPIDSNSIQLGHFFIHYTKTEQRLAWKFTFGRGQMCLLFASDKPAKPDVAYLDASCTFGLLRRRVVVRPCFDELTPAGRNYWPNGGLAIRSDGSAAVVIYSHQSPIGPDNPILLDLKTGTVAPQSSSYLTYSDWVIEAQVQSGSRPILGKVAAQDDSRET